MIYTCYDMVRDCRAGRPEGRSYFVSQYVPVIQKLVARYFPECAADGTLIGRLLVALDRPESSLFQSLDPAPERWFVAELRQRVLAAVEDFQGQPVPEPEIDLETLGSALEPFTMVEKQAAWLETMRYTAEEVAVLLRMDPRTVEKIRDKARERIRSCLNVWRRTLLADNGRPLGRAAARAHTEPCLADKAFLDVLDGRATWRGREEMERHVSTCWHCIDHFCRLAEVVELLRRLTPLSEAGARPFYDVLGIPRRSEPAWKRWLR